MDKMTGIDRAILKYNLETYINKGKGTVTLKLDPESIVVYRFLRGVCDQMGLHKNLYHNLVRSPYLDMNPNRFIATAKCHPKDEFDEDIGASVAFRKLKGKVRKNIINALISIFGDCSDAMTNLYDLYTEDKLQDGKDISDKNVFRLFNMMDEKTEYDWDDEEDYDE